MEPQKRFFLDKFSIEAFRGLAAVRLEKLGPVNLLVGGNNAGKTSVLEALAVLSSPLSLTRWARVARFRDPNSRVGSMIAGLSNIDALRWLFPTNLDEKAAQGAGMQSLLPIRLEGIGSGGKMSIFAECQELIGIPPRRGFGNSDSEGEEVRLDRGWKIKMRIEDGELLPNQPNLWVTEQDLWKGIGFAESRQSRGGVHPAIFLTPYSHRNEPLLLGGVSKLIEGDQKDSLIRALTGIDQRLLDVVISAEDEGERVSLRVKLSGVGWAPVSVMGDGFRRALSIGVALIEARDGVLLIDEIETALHVSVIEKLFGWLVKTSRELNVQIFATTHSLEAISAMVEAMPEGEREQLAAYHLGVSGDSTAVKRYGGEMLGRLVQERGLDIR